jgi:hypothetical protein
MRSEFNDVCCWRTGEERGGEGFRGIDNRRPWSLEGASM